MFDWLVPFSKQAQKKRETSSFPALLGVWRNPIHTRNKSISRYARAFRLKLCESSCKNRQIFSREESSFNAVIYVVSFHAILRFLLHIHFVFMGYCLCFIGAKIHNFSKVQGIGGVFSLFCVSTQDAVNSIKPMESIITPVIHPNIVYPTNRKIQEIG